MRAGEERRGGPARVAAPPPDRCERGVDCASGFDSSCRGGVPAESAMAALPARRARRGGACQRAAAATGALLFAFLLLVASAPKAHSAGWDSTERDAKYYRNWGHEWPLDSPYNFRDPRELAQREAELMKEMDPNKRFDNWRVFGQELFIPNMTAKGLQVEEMPRPLYNKLYKFVHDNVDKMKIEEGVTDPSSAITSRAALPAMIWLPKELQKEIIETLQPIHERWCKCKLQFNALYGVRVYFDQTVLAQHLDKKETHIISSVLHIAHDILEPWPLVLRDHFGRYHAVNLDAGEMLHYEGGKLVHARPTVLRGAWYANAFLHFSPVPWNITLDAAIAAVPPYYKLGLPGFEDESTVDLSLLNGTKIGTPEREQMIADTMRRQRDRRGWPHDPLLDPTRESDEAAARLREGAQRLRQAHAAAEESAQATDVAHELISRRNVRETSTSAVGVLGRGATSGWQRWLGGGLVIAGVALLAVTLLAPSSCWGGNGGASGSVLPKTL